MAVQTPPPIDPVPTPPIQRGDRATFSSRVDAFILWLVAAVAQFRAVALNVAANATEALGFANAAATSASDALGYRGTTLTYRNEAQQARTDAQTFAQNASTSATDAATSATAAANSATALTATSATSNTIGGGAKSFVIQAGKQFAPGVNIKAVDATNAANAMYGTVTSYSGTALVMAVTTFEGSGTVANWNVSVVGQRGPQGPIGGGRVFNETNMTTGGTWVSDSEDFKIILQGAGSGGKQLLGGSSGGYVEKTFRGVPLGTVCIYVQGAAGIGTTGTSANGTNGGDSTFTVPGFGAVTAGGGGVQAYENESTNPAARHGGTAVGGDLNIPGQVGDDPTLYEYIGNPTVFFPKKGGDGAASLLGLGGVGRVGQAYNASKPARGYGAGGAGGSQSAINEQGNASNGGPSILRIIR